MRLLFLCLIVFLTVPVTVEAKAPSALALPDVVSMDLQTFVSNSEKITKEFTDDPYLNFEVQLPKDLTERHYNVLKHYESNNRVYGEVYRKDGIAVEDVRPYFSVRAHELSRYISAKNWFVTNLMSNNGSLRGLETDKKGDSFEALYVRFDTLGRTEVVRAKGVLKGSRVITAEYVVPPLLWEEQRDIQTFVIKSFEFKGALDNQNVEPLMSYSHLESFSMNYPQSWRLDTNSRDVENRIDLSFFTADEMMVVFSKIEITLVADQSLNDPLDRSRYPTYLPQIIRERKAAIEEQGLIVGDVMERRTYDLSFEAGSQVTEIYPLRKKLTNYVTHRKAPISREFWVTVIKGTEESGKNYIVSMIVPSRTESSAKKWALAAKAYEVMIETMR